MSNNAPNPLNGEWQRENCHSTLPAWLIFAGPIFGKLLLWDDWKWLTVPLMLLGIHKTRGWWLKAMALVCVFLVLFGPLRVTLPGADGPTAMAVCYWAVAWYIRWYADGQEYKRKSSGRDWEED